MSCKQDGSSQNKMFLSLARQFNFLSEETTEEHDDVDDAHNGHNSNDGDEEKDFYEIILELMELQDKIGKLQLIEKKVELRDRFSGLTEPSSLSWIAKELSQVSESLLYITNHASRIQLKLANPAISNSVPLPCQLHECLISLTKLLSDIQFSAERSSDAASWLTDQDWTHVSRSLAGNKHNAEKLVARLKTISSKIQLFRDRIRDY